MIRDSSPPAERKQPVARNPKATHDYHILETWECGIVLTGTEVKSLRTGKASIKEALRSQAGIQDFDARYDAALQEVRTDASTGALLKVGSTPTVYVNGRMISGRLPNGQSMGMPQAKYLNALIDIELKRAK